MKSIILKPHELANIDRLTCIVRPMKEPHGWTTKLIDGEHRKWPAKPVYDKHEKCKVTGLVNPPFSTGETVFVKEAFYYQKWLGIPLSERQPIVYASGTTKDQVEDYFFCNARYMPQWASRYTITPTSVEAKQAKALSDEEIKGNCIKPDMVDSGGQNPDGSWIDVADYVHPFLMAYNVEPYTWLWLWKVEVER